MPAKQVPGQLEHVVRIAGFAGIVAEALVEFACVAAVFVVAVATDDVGVVVDHRFPKKGSNGLVAGIAREFILTSAANGFGYVGIGVFAGQGINFFGKWLHHKIIVELVGEVQVFFFSGKSVHVGQNFVHAAVFTFQHFLALDIVEFVYHRGCPVGHSFEHLQGLIVVGIKVGIGQSGHYFVDGVPR